MKPDTLKDRLQNLIVSKGILSRAEAMSTIKFANQKQLSNIVHQLKVEKKILIVKRGQYSISGNVGIVPSQISVPEKQERSSKDILSSLIHVQADQLDTTLDLLHKSIFYEGALKAQIHASKVISNIRRTLCGQVL